MDGLGVFRHGVFLSFYFQQRNLYFISGLTIWELQRNFPMMICDFEAMLLCWHIHFRILR